MAKYLFSRLTIVFLCKFFVNWVLNIEFHLTTFFDLSEGTGLTILMYVCGILILALGLFVTNFIFTIFNLTDYLSLKEITEEVRERGLFQSFMYFLRNFGEFLNDNLSHEFQSDRYGQLFLFTALFFLPFVNGNFILNGYYGIYKEYEFEEGNIEKQYVIVRKTNEADLKRIMNNLEENAEEDEPYFEIKKKGYLFIEAGVIDGYRNYYLRYDGFSSYIECLLFSALEKFITTIMYFLIPFVIFILIYHYKFEGKE